MKLTDLDFFYPNELVALCPQSPPRVMWSQSFSSNPEELTFAQTLSRFEPGDLIVINETRVQKRRVFAPSQREIVFLEVASDGLTWKVLMPAKDLRLGQEETLPGGISFRLIEKGIPQTVCVSEALGEDYFAQFGEVPLPPYIQQNRGQRHSSSDDDSWYQTDYARYSGSAAAPTAGLHFRRPDLLFLRSRGVRIASLTLHVGLGTFLPVTVDDLDQHKMHSESVLVPKTTLQAIEETRVMGRRVYAVGTTVTRALESVPLKKLTETPFAFVGQTDLLIKPQFQFQMVDGLMTNFHQPKSTLLALVAAFAGLPTVKSHYQWAIDRKFKLFSYGDLTVWTK